MIKFILVNIKLALVLILLFSFKIKAAEIKGNVSGGSSSTALDFSSVATKSDIATATSAIAIAGGVSTTTIAGTTFTLSASISVSTFQWMPCIPILGSSFSATNVQSLSLTLPGIYSNVEFICDSSGTSNSNAGLAVYFNDDQSTLYSHAKEINNTLTSNSTLSSATFTTGASIVISEPLQFRFIVSGNHIPRYRTIFYSGSYWANPGQPYISWGYLGYRKATSITKITLTTYATAAAGVGATLTGPVRIMVKAYNEP